MMRKTLFMETTAVPVERTVGEVSSELIRAGATQIAQSFANGKITGIRWTMLVQGIDALFELPARIDPVFAIINGRRKSSWDRTQKAADDRAQSERVAWRQLLRWVQAQNAMIETGMVQPMEVFTAYWIPPGQDPGNERTLFQNLIERQFKALPAPQEKQ